LLVVCDIETDDLKATKVWVAVCKDIDTGIVNVFERPDLNPEPFVAYAKGVTRWIGHSFISFDAPTLSRLVRGVFIDPATVIDTLVVSRLVDYKIAGGHGLEAWGNRVGVPKPYVEDFADFGPHIIQRCIEDVEINHKVFDRLKPYIYSPLWRTAMRLEHQTEIMCRELHLNGFAFDKVKADALLNELTSERDTLEAEFQQLFPPRYRAVREINPGLTKKGTLHRGDFRWCPDDQLHYYDAGCPFTLIEPVVFDPASKQQIIDRLWEAGWKPVNKTDGHKDYAKQSRRGNKDPDKADRFNKYGWKVDDTNLATLPPDAPEGAKKLTRWLHLTGRVNQLKGWCDAYREDTGRIHGRFMGIGAWSGRMSHNNPNMANASSEHEYRELWVADEKKLLLGCDAEGIQLRILAHYIDDPVFTEALVKGDKKAGTDAHSLNARALGEVCLKWGDQARDRAKTFIYAFVLGAAAAKIAEIFGCSTRDAEAAVAKFIAAYPGLKLLREDRIPRDAARGYFQGFDGRFVKCDSEHLMLAGYLQSGESTIMKYATQLWQAEAREKRLNISL
jgi:DNA polymerase-1